MWKRLRGTNPNITLFTNSSEDAPESELRAEWEWCEGKSAAAWRLLPSVWFNKLSITSVSILLYLFYFIIQHFVARYVSRSPWWIKLINTQVTTCHFTTNLNSNMKDNIFLKMQQPAIVWRSLPVMWDISRFYSEKPPQRCVEGSPIIRLLLIHTEPSCSSVRRFSLSFNTASRGLQSQRRRHRCDV